MSSSWAPSPNVDTPICSRPRTPLTTGVGAPQSMASCRAWFTSLTIRAIAKFEAVGLPSDICCSITLEVRLRPDPLLITSVMAASGRPILRPMATISSVARRAPALSMLFTSFMAWLSPTRSPQQNTLGLMADSTGSARS